MRVQIFLKELIIDLNRTPLVGNIKNITIIGPVMNKISVAEVRCSGNLKYDFIFGKPDKSIFSIGLIQLTLKI